MRHVLLIFALALLMAGVLCVVQNSSHGLGTGANEWNYKSFGWPVEIWSRTTHTYTTLTISPEGRKVERTNYPTRYSVKWLSAGIGVGAAFGVSWLITLWIPGLRVRRR